jgi:hypothetical protein
MVLPDRMDLSRPVSFNYDGTNWYLHFTGIKGHQMLDNWLEFIRTDPECRRALMMPPLPPDLKLAA